MKGVKTGGRKKGVPNKNSALIMAMCNHLVDGGLEKFEKEMDKLKGKTYVNAFIGLAKLCSSDNRTIQQANAGLIELLNKKLQNNGTTK